ncbi:phosphoribosylformylglycinamidine synthase [Flavobacterium sp. Sd200]|uniref:HAEPLYID family protein n=1 Tax=Flavobacterium sp. Sd200 TaxID=2692211 RepID=UPI001369EB18|nr:HAEPLYID family protein [Flavobacterium sp. Sd200]MXN92694.1 phosphoribosylformylglycinamidine synthase [Flavobacterium sp. Sd200]
MKKIFALTALVFAFCVANAQSLSDTIPKTDVPKKPLKLSHAEPLYIDLIRDLGACKGERELNLGFGINNEKEYVTYSGFAEYEFAIANRLGLEVEVPFEMYSHTNSHPQGSLPANRVEGIKLATQYTFLVSAKYQTSMAVGYIQEMEFSSLPDIDHHGKLFEGTVYNPIFIAAKRLTPHIHTLLYTGPMIRQTFETNEWNTSLDVNANLHYVFTNGNFAGLETNMEFLDGKPSFVLHPQFKVAFSKKVSLGIVAGLPLSGNNHTISGMTRMIWVP